MSSSNRVGLYYVRESVPGTTPATPGFKQLRFTGDDLDNPISHLSSPEIRDDRQKSDLTLVDSNPGGSVNIAFSATSFDELLESLMCDAWGDDLAISSSTITADNDGATLTTSTIGEFDDIVVGQNILVTGGLNDGVIFRVDAIVGDELTVFPAPATEAAGTALTVTGSMIRNGLTDTSYTLMKRWADIGPLYEYFRGQHVGSMNLKFATEQNITGSFAFMGRTAEATASAIAGQTLTDAPETELMNAVTGLTSIMQDEDELGTAGEVQSMSFDMNNTLRANKAVAVFGNAAIKTGTVAITGNLTLYFESLAQVTKYNTSTPFMLSFTLADSDGNMYVVTMPQVKFTQLQKPTEGLDADVYLNGQYEAYRHPTLGCTVQVDRFVAA